MLLRLVCSLFDTPARVRGLPLRHHAGPREGAVGVHQAVRRPAAYELLHVFFISAGLRDQHRMWFHTARTAVCLAD